MALGIDAAAHRGALDAEGRTVAVLGNGLGSVYPASHRALADQIAAGGALVSEFPCDHAPRPFNFPRRNRVISGLSVGVLVVEAGLRSGSLITARLALEQGREVFAVPGCIRNPVARGCHKLIRDGAKLVETIDDVVEELEPLARFVSGCQRDPAAAARPAKALDAGSKLLLDNIGYQPVSIDFLIEATTIPPGLTASLLSQLEIAGLVEALPGGNYVRR
jgi:DNA processing protein